MLQDLHDLFKDKLQNLEIIQKMTKNSKVFSQICKDNHSSITKISSYSTTRFNSLYKTISSFNLNIRSVFDFLQIKEVENPFKDEDFVFYQEFQFLLVYFNDVIKLFETDEFGQISKIHAEFNSIQEAISNVIDESLYLKEHKKDIITIFENRKKMVYDSYGDLIYATSLLHPNKFYAVYLTQNEIHTEILIEYLYSK